MSAVTSRHAEGSGPIIFFDGVCVLCNGFVDWVIHHDPQATFRFASLQGETAAALRVQLPQLPEQVETLVLWEGGELSYRSTAIFFILRRLPQPWRGLTILRFLPRWLRDLGYRFIARIRYAVFGKTEVCRVPTPEEKGRLLP